jgi:hypothetical protein
MGIGDGRREMPRYLHKKIQCRFKQDIIGKRNVGMQIGSLSARLRNAKLGSVLFFSQ